VHRTGTPGVRVLTDSETKIRGDSCHGAIHVALPSPQFEAMESPRSFTVLLHTPFILIKLEVDSEPGTPDVSRRSLDNTALAARVLYS
jgi:hypothetical protein